MKYVAWGFIIALAVLHQDFWNWDDGSLVFGFLPVGLAYHIVLSLLASAAWLLAVNIAWPVDPESEQAPRPSSTEEKGASE